MKRLSILAVFSISSICLIQCGKTPQTHYYKIENPNFELPNTTPQFDIVVGVNKIIADPPYDQDRIIYQSTANEINFYHYQRWITEPREMLTESVISHLRKSSLFAGVIHLRDGQPFDYILSGELIQFEEWDEQEQWYAQVKIWFELLSLKTRQTMWEGITESRIPIKKKKTIEVVRAINSAADQCIEQLIQQLSTSFKMEN